jgi:hypothetical protein
MKTSEVHLERQSFWQVVFSQSKVNGAPYFGEQFPARNWKWPEDTYLQRRLRDAKWSQTVEKTSLN